MRDKKWNILLNNLTIKPSYKYDKNKGLLLEWENNKRYLSYKISNGTVSKVSIPKIENEYIFDKTSIETIPMIIYPSLASLASSINNELSKE